MAFTPYCVACEAPMTLVRSVPGWTYTPGVECYQCICEAYETLQIVKQDVPIVGPHAKPRLTDREATPGLVMFGRDNVNMQPRG
jgi:hypothetical protein